MLCNVDPGFVRSVAEMLERLAELAPHWAEPYAAPFVPIIESGVRVARAVDDWLGATGHHRHTGHGHPCCGEAPVGGRPDAVARCGGPAICAQCALDVGRIHGGRS